MPIFNSRYEQLVEEIISQAELVCNVCGSKGRIECKGGDRYVRCTWRSCYKVRSLWKSTIFEGNRLEHTSIIAILDLWMMGMNNSMICRVAMIDRKTLWRLLVNVSDLLVPRYYRRFGKIGGENTIVEVDESKFGKRKCNRGHVVDGVWVLGAVERTPERRIFLIKVADRTKPTIATLLKRFLERQSVLYTDCFKSYIGADKYFSTHNTVNHSVGFVDKETGAHTNTIEGNWAAVKAQTPIRCRTDSLISLYLIRYMIKRNTNRPLEELLKYLF